MTDNKDIKTLTSDDIIKLTEELEIIETFERLKKDIDDFENRRKVKVKYIEANKETIDKYELNKLNWEVRENDDYKTAGVFLFTGEGIDSIIWLS